MFVTDTHAISHYAQEKHSKLGRKARRLFKQADDDQVLIHIPTVVLWEIAVHIRNGHIELRMRFEHWCNLLQIKRGFILEPLEWSDVRARWLARLER